MIRDRLVVGIRHHSLSEKLQMDSELTLEKEVTTIRQHKEIKKTATFSERNKNYRTKKDECRLTESTRQGRQPMDGNKTISRKDRKIVVDVENDQHTP